MHAPSFAFVRFRSSAPRARLACSAFTLIELLTVIAIIGILAAIVIPTVGRVRASAQAAKCGSNMRQMATFAAVWAQENKDFTPQACWAWKTIPSYLNATNLRSVGYKDEVGTCGAVTDGVTYPPHYGLNGNLSKGDFANNTTGYYVHGPYKFSRVLSSRTILFAETKWVQGWGFNASAVTDAAPAAGGRTSAYLATTTTFDARHSGKGYVAYADAHIALKTAAELNLLNPNPWAQGIGE